MEIFDPLNGKLPMSDNAAFRVCALNALYGLVIVLRVTHYFHDFFAPNRFANEAVWQTGYLLCPIQMQLNSRITC